jgi:DnaK suppressor protein
VTALELKAFKVRLQELHAELSLQIAAPDSTSESIRPDNAIGRLTRMEAMQAQQMNEAGKRRDQARLKQVEKALVLIDEGGYGTCVRCESHIPAGRLEIRPESRLCVRCASRV